MGEFGRDRRPLKGAKKNAQQRCPGSFHQNKKIENSTNGNGKVVTRRAAYQRREPGSNPPDAARDVVKHRGTREKETGEIGTSEKDEGVNTTRCASVKPRSYSCIDKVPIGGPAEAREF